MIACWPLNVTALPDINPWSFPNATKLPVKVNDPIKTLKHTMINGLFGDDKNSEDATKEDAATPRP